MTRKNSITFMLENYKTFGGRAKLMEDGSIVKERVDMAIDDVEIYEEIKKNAKELKLKQMKNIICISMVLLSIVGTILLKNHLFIAVVIFLLFDKTMCDNSSLNFILNIYVFNKKMKSVRGLHAAEHMALMAYNDLNRIPNKKEIRKYSKFSSKCSTITPYREGIYMLIYFMLYGFIPYNLDLPIKIIAMIIALAITILATREQIFKYFCLYSVKDPTDKEVEVANAALEEYESMKADFEEDPDRFIYEMHKKRRFKPHFIIIIKTSENCYKSL